MTIDPEKEATRPARSPIDEPNAGRTPWVILAAATSGAIVLFALSRYFGPAPTLAPAMRLAATGKLAEAEAALYAYIKHDPKDVRARIILADLLINLSPPKAAEALAVLEPASASGRSQKVDVHVLRGKAFEAAHRPGRAETEWKAALEVDPLAPEAGALLLQLYYVEGRADESRRLALRLSEAEPDPGDRVRLLLAPIQFDAEPVAASGVITLLKDAIAADPGDPGSSRAYYLALVRDGVGIDEGMNGLRELVRKAPDDPSNREALLQALQHAGDQEGLEKAIADVPASLANDPKIAVYRGILASRKDDWASAIREFEAAAAANPADKATFHRLAEAYKRAGRAADAEAATAREDDIEKARIELRGIKGRESTATLGRPGLYDDLATRSDLGLVPNPVLYHQVADLRERMGHPDEALAWHKLVLRDDPDDAESRAAVTRLEKVVDTSGKSH